MCISQFSPTFNNILAEAKSLIDWQEGGRREADQLGQTLDCLKIGLQWWSLNSFLISRKLVCPNSVALDKFKLPIKLYLKAWLNFNLYKTSEVRFISQPVLRADGSRPLRLPVPLGTDVYPKGGGRGLPFKTFWFSVVLLQPLLLCIPSKLQKQMNFTLHIPCLGHAIPQ